MFKNRKNKIESCNGKSKHFILFNRFSMDSSIYVIEYSKNILKSHFDTIFVASCNFSFCKDIFFSSKLNFVEEKREEKHHVSELLM